jgi:hypothetical protein
MSPGSKRSLLRYFVILASSLVVIPLMSVLSRSSVMTWLAAALLLVSAIVLFRSRSRTRTAFLLPICYAPFLIAARIGVVRRSDSGAFTGVLLIGLVLVLSAMVVDGFWSPYKDDLEELEYRSTRRD